jgi:dynein heavy chain, axonemal
MDHPDFSFIQVDRCSMAAKGLYMWVKAVRNFYYVYKMNEVYRDKMCLADLQQEKLEKLNVNHRATIAILTVELDDLSYKFMKKESEIKSFTK